MYKWYSISICDLCSGKGFVETQKQSNILRTHEYLNGDSCPLCEGIGELKIYSKEK